MQRALGLPSRPAMSNSSLSTVNVGATNGITPSQTASAIVAEVVSGSHVLTIKGYSRTKGLGIGKCITSEKFAIGGHDWCIRYYPDGQVMEDADWVAVHLKRDDNTDEDVKATYKISLLDQDGLLVSSHSHTSELRGFSPKGGWGFNKFIRRTDLEESNYLKDDSFSLKCDIAITGVIRTVASETRATQFVVVPPSDLNRHLLQLLTSGQAGDVTFEVGGESFTAHRYILAARSSVFMAELFGSMKEKDASCVRIDDMEARVFKAMLHFIYTDSLPEIDEGEAMEMAQHLLVAADRYNLDRLKLICEKTLCDYISRNTAAVMLALAEQHGCEGLKEACFSFLASVENLKAVVASDGFAHLRSSCSSILEELVTRLNSC
uniref:Uncharacterized protein n=1 Tax=Avena sativa TaxID=4498 RepID=A0ACD5V4W6_AVESA